MALEFESDVPPETTGFMLCKIVGDDDLKIAEAVTFEKGRPAVMTTLNRASISGHVGGGIDGHTRFWADLLDADGDTIGEIRLDSGSWNALRTRWMRCSMQRPS
ncbi:hypothetical protein DL1_08725 [Thioclava dalianensis]|uniref:Uncharacterized protein n=1 Tax=Thioclava dalianensis TaxID=1185766 RepID=A0A074TFC0_9RHOB|nr:hypothetical protein [Thioclava dalianensis]KEP68840.1 hypothetical protein DL1_08725 [Thioclava dalianensis]SFN48977.1 hypothetical protein SAMN05216224_10644 [Thioclava dalianensis]